MPPADKRITIRDKTTGEVRHGIAGHIPKGWESIDGGSPKVEATENHKVADTRQVSRTGPGRDKDLVSSRMQAVRRTSGDKTDERS